MNNRLIKSNDAGGACTNTVDLYNPFPDGGGVALYQLNGDATDVSGNYDGTATNVTYGTGEFGQAGVFNGSSSSINTGFAQNTSNAFSWSFWFNGNSLQTGIPLIIDTTGSTSPYPGVGVGYEGGAAYVFISGGTVTPGVSVLPNTWAHVVLTHDGSGNFSFYVNNTPIFTNISRTSNLYSGQNILLGDTTVWNKFNGSIDQVRIFSRALRPYEVEALYTEEYCTPNIVPSEHFNTVTYTGTGSTGTQIPVGFQPDFVWFKNRSDTDWHILQDSVRGVDKSIFSNAVDAEETYANFIQQLNATGYTIGSDGQINQSGLPYVSWNFKAGGDAVTNTDGTITSQVSANTEAGFSVVKYTGNGVSGATVGHGLIDSPSMIIIKNTVENSATGSGTNWRVYHKDLTAGYNIMLNQTNAQSATPAAFTTTPPSSTVFTLGNFVGTNATVSGGSAEYIAYCFAEVEGFSKIGSYVGNGGVNTIVTGFEPAFMLFRAVDIAFPWELVDNKRPDGELNANNSDAERIENTPDFLENGFRLTTERYNNSGQKFIYMAFAADPTAVEPSLEDSFNTVTYTGQSVPYPVTVGFQPDLIWVKSRTYAYLHGLFDTLRPNGRFLQSNTTDAESASNNTAFHTLTDTGFIWTETAGGFNATGDYVAWNWKGAEIPAINSNGSIPSVVSANPAAGFSIVSYNSNGVAGSTIGHGLSASPNMIIIKNRDDVDKWAVYHSAIGGTQFLVLNEAALAVSSSAYWNNTNPNSSVFTVGSTSPVNSPNNEDYIAYCFAEVAGFSKFGSYNGNGSTGNKQTLDFEPAFVLIKRTNDAGAWSLYDNKRSPSNPRDKKLVPNSSAAENIAGTTYQLNFYSDGFDFNGGGYDLNGSGGTFIYMAFANQF